MFISAMICIVDKKQHVEILDDFNIICHLHHKVQKIKTFLEIYPFRFFCDLNQRHLKRYNKKARKFWKKNQFSLMLLSKIKFELDIFQILWSPQNI